MSNGLLLTRAFNSFVNKHTEASKYFSVYTSVNLPNALGKTKNMFYLASLITSPNAHDQKTFF